MCFFCNMAITKKDEGGFNTLHPFFFSNQTRILVTGFRSVSREAMRVARAKAEERRAMAIALEQEMKAKAQEMKAKVIEAEVKVPLAIAEAFRSGNLGVMDFMRYKNIMADTSMRDSIAGEDIKGEK